MSEIDQNIINLKNKLLMHSKCRNWSNEIITLFNNFVWSNKISLKYNCMHIEVKEHRRRLNKFLSQNDCIDVVETSKSIKWDLLWLSQLIFANIKRMDTTSLELSLNSLWSSLKLPKWSSFANRLCWCCQNIDSIKQDLPRSI